MTKVSASKGRVKARFPHDSLLFYERCRGVSDLDLVYHLHLPATLQLPCSVCFMTQPWRKGSYPGMLIYIVLATFNYLVQFAL